MRMQRILCCKSRSALSAGAKGNGTLPVASAILAERGWLTRLQGMKATSMLKSQIMPRCSLLRLDQDVMAGKDELTS